MIIWMLESYDEAQDDLDMLVFDSELAVKQQACSTILDLINELTLKDQDYLNEAQEINDLISVKDIQSYTQAINKWNSCSINLDLISVYFTCRDMLVHPTADADVPDLLDPAFFCNHVKSNISKSNSSTDSSINTNSNTVSYGATCKKCNYHNEYVIAEDSQNYLCRSCKMFYNVFS